MSAVRVPTSDFASLQKEVVQCARCPRLVEWRERVAREKRAAYAGERYWGRPVPAFGDPAGRVLVVGLAPAAHGANRTGRMFTGDRSGDWLYRALHRAGFADRPDSVGRGDGLRLDGILVTAALRCAPPANKPTPTERDACAPWLDRELDLMPDLRVIVALGGFAYTQTLRIVQARGLDLPRPRPRFSHGAQVDLTSDLTLVCSYHPSQQNTFTGRLTEPMFDEVWAQVRAIVKGHESGRP